MTPDLFLLLGIIVLLVGFASIALGLFIYFAKVFLEIEEDKNP